MELLRNSRSGHLGSVTRTLNSIAAILAINPKNISYKEVRKLEFGSERCDEQETCRQRNVVTVKYSAKDSSAEPHNKEFLEKLKKKFQNNFVER